MKKTLSIITLVLGIISVLISCCGAGYIGIAGVIIGIIALKKEKKNVMSIIGIVLSGIAIIVSFIITIVFGVSFFSGRQGVEPVINETSEYVHQVESVEENSQIVEQESIIEEEIIMPNVGDYILFGTYEQDDLYDNGTEPIEWKVLDVQDGKVLLISKYVLDAKPFHEYDEYTLWEECTLRQWLNNDFYNVAFSDADKLQIVETTLQNPDNTYRGVAEGGNPTVDKVFILSWDELIKYFPDGTWVEGNSVQYCEETICENTAYAVHQGLYTYYIDEYSYENNLRQYGYSPLCIKESVTMDWWLRTPGVYWEENGSTEKSDGFLDVDYWGRSGLYYESNATTEHNGVRPAIWVEYDNSMEITVTAEEIEQAELEAWEQMESEEQMAFEMAEYEKELWKPNNNDIVSGENVYYTAGSEMNAIYYVKEWYEIAINSGLSTNTVLVKEDYSIEKYISEDGTEGFRVRVYRDNRACEYEFALIDTAEERDYYQAIMQLMGLPSEADGMRLSYDFVSVDNTNYYPGAVVLIHEVLDNTDWPTKEEDIAEYEANGYTVIYE